MRSFSYLYNRQNFIPFINSLKKVLVLALIIAVSICSAGPLFTLSLEYALRQGYSSQTCKGEIWWNGQLVLSLSSQDSQVKTASVNVYAKDGENILQLRGAGISDNTGLTVDNIKLVKEGTTQNLVVNGGFENPKIDKDWKGFHEGIQGWSAVYMEIGVGTYFNPRWPSQVCELDGDGNSVITQKFIIRYLYTLSIDFAAREDSPLETSQGQVWWNYEKVLNLQPNNYDLKTLSTKVYAKPGQNVLQLRGIGPSDYHGLTVDNIRLVKDGDQRNLIINSGFQNPRIEGRWQGFVGGIEGWICTYMEVGNGVVFNKRWNSQVCELDASSNSIITQLVMIDSDNQCCACLRNSNAPGAPIIPLPAFIPQISNIPLPPFRNC